MESNGKEKHLYAMESAERSKFSQNMSKETTVAINHATRVAIRKSSLKKFALLVLTPITRHKRRVHPLLKEILDPPLSIEW